MKQLVVLSGKGGTGKTSLAAALADLASRERALVLVDADADAANLGLLLDPVPLDRVPFYGADRAVIDPARCMGCGACADVCRFGAIIENDVFTVDGTACEGCRACALECPEAAIRMERVQAGAALHADTQFGPLFHGDLLPGQENSGKLVAALRRSATACANDSGANLVLIDGPPGIGCPALAASTGTDLALLVTEPSLSALHDLDRILETVTHFQIPAVACLNKADLHDGIAERIRDFLESRGVPLVGEVPFHPGLITSVERGRPATALGDTDLDRLFLRIWAGVRTALDDGLPTAGVPNVQSQSTFYHLAVVSDTRRQWSPRLRCSSSSRSTLGVLLDAAMRHVHRASLVLPDLEAGCQRPCKTALAPGGPPTRERRGCRAGHAM